MTKNLKTGPASADHLQALTSYDLRALTFGSSAFVPLEGINVHVARGGYTGEDGFEVCPKPTCGSSFTGADSRTDLRSSCSCCFPRIGAPPSPCSTRRSGRPGFPEAGGRNVSVWQRPGREHHARRGWSFLGYRKRPPYRRGLHRLGEGPGPAEEWATQAARGTRR